jgi:DNA-binding HxlR family transcriptional regulator
MRRKTGPRSRCPISMALDLLGDPWTLLVVRDLMFKRLSRFNEFQSAGEGIATNVLADRLARLETAGIVTKRRDLSDGRRFVYNLTRQGLDLAPTLMELVIWSAGYHDTAAPAETVRAFKTQRAKALASVRAAWNKTTPPV